MASMQPQVQDDGSTLQALAADIDSDDDFSCSVKQFGVVAAVPLGTITPGASSVNSEPERTGRRAKGAAKPKGKAKATPAVPKISPTKPKDPPGGKKNLKRDKVKKVAGNWQDRQKAARELQAAEKLMASLEVAAKQFGDDAESVSVSESDNILKRLDKSLSEDIRWVYDGEDIDPAADGAAEAIAVRSDTLGKLKAAARQFNAIVPALKSMSANSAKHPELYDLDFFKRALDDCVEAQVPVSSTLLQKYQDRGVELHLQTVKKTLTDAWAHLLESNIVRSARNHHRVWVSGVVDKKEYIQRNKQSLFYRYLEVLLFIF